MKSSDLILVVRMCATYETHLGDKLNQRIDAFLDIHEPFVSDWPEEIDTEPVG